MTPAEGMTPTKKLTGGSACRGLEEEPKKIRRDSRAETDGIHGRKKGLLGGAFTGLHSTFCILHSACIQDLSVLLCSVEPPPKKLSSLVLCLDRFGIGFRTILDWLSLGWLWV